MLRKQLYIYITFFITVLSLPVYAQDESISVFAEGSVEYYKAILESKLAFDNDSYEDAEALLLNVVAADPSHIDSWDMLGTIYWKRLSYKSAKNAYNEIINIDPGYVPAYQGLALAQEALGEYKDALLNYRYFIDNYDGEEKDLAVFRAAELYCRFGKYYDAVPLYQTLLSDRKSKFSEKARYYYNNINNNMARYRGKKVILDKVPYIVPQYNNCMPSALAAALIYWGEPVSEQELSQVLMDTQEGGFTIDMIDYVRSIGFEALMFEGNLKEVYYWINQKVPVIVSQVWTDLEGQNIQHLRTIHGYDKLKMSLYTSDKFQIPVNEFMRSWSKADYQMFVILPPDKIDIFPFKKPRDAEYIARADRFDRKGDYKKAYQMYLEAEIETGNNVKAKLGQAKALLKMNKVSQATEELEQLLEAHPENQEAYFLLGIIHFNNKRYDKAFEYLCECDSLDEKLMAQVYNFLGFIILEQGGARKAIEKFDMAIKKDSQYFYAYYNRARAYAQIGNLDRTVDDLRKCINSKFITDEKIFKDESFSKLKDYPEFQDLKN